MFKKSTNPLAKEIGGKKWVGAGGGGKKKKAKFTSVVSVFHKGITTLMKNLAATEPYIVRCVNPNKNKSPKEWDESHVEKQLRCGGLVEALQVLTLGYPTRVPYDTLYDKFHGVIDNPLIKQLQSAAFAEAILVAWEVTRADYELGLTKIFFKPAKAAILDEILDMAGKPLTKEQNDRITKWVVGKRVRQVFGSIKTMAKCVQLVKKLRGRQNWNKWGRVIGFIACTWIRQLKVARDSLEEKKRQAAAKVIGCYWRGFTHTSKTRAEVKEKKEAAVYLIENIQLYKQRKDFFKWLNDNVERTREQKRIEEERRRKEEEELRKRLEAERIAREKAEEEQRKALAAAKKAEELEALKKKQEEERRLAEEKAKKEAQELAEKQERERIAREKAEEERRRKELEEKARKEKEQAELLAKQAAEREAAEEAARLKAQKEQEEGARLAKEEEEKRKAAEKAAKKEAKKALRERQRKKKKDEKANFQKQLAADREEGAEAVGAAHHKDNFPEMYVEEEDPYSDGSDASDDSSDDDAVAQDFQRAASTGQLFLKHTGKRRRKPQDRFVKVSFDADGKAKTISWGSGSRHINFDAIRTVTWGHWTPCFLERKEQLDPNVCFSVISNEQVLDLQAPDRSVAELWVLGLRGLLGINPVQADDIAQSMKEKGEMPGLRKKRDSKLDRRVRITRNRDFWAKPPYFP